MRAFDDAPTRTIREQLEAVRDEAAQLGAEVLGFEFGQTHPYAIIRFHGKQRRLSFSGSPRSGRENAARCSRQKLRRMVREMQ